MFAMGQQNGYPAQYLAIPQQMQQQQQQVQHQGLSPHAMSPSHGEQQHQQVQGSLPVTQQMVSVGPSDAIIRRVNSNNSAQAPVEPTEPKRPKVVRKKRVSVAKPPEPQPMEGLPFAILDMSRILVVENGRPESKNNFDNCFMFIVKF